MIFLEGTETSYGWEMKIHFIKMNLHAWGGMPYFARCEKIFKFRQNFLLHRGLWFRPTVCSS